MELKEFYDSVRSLTPGADCEYKSLRLEKAGKQEFNDPSSIQSPDHSEVFVYNRDTHVETFSLSAMSYRELRSRLDEIVEKDPDSMQDWLDR